MKKALITGVTGQDGSYLTELLLEKGYEVHGIKRRSSLINTDRIDHILNNKFMNSNNFFLHFGDVLDSSSLMNLISSIEPNEIYNLAAQSHVAVSFENPEITSEINALGTLKILETIKNCKLINHTKFYQASTSELYGKVVETPQTENTPFHPRSPYGVAKLYSYWITRNYREAYNLFACNGILFNHESPRRGETFVTRKITRALSLIHHGKLDKLIIGNLDSLRDWGHAKDYVEMQWLMLQQDTPDDFVIATGEQHSVRDFIEVALEYIGVTLSWEGSGINTKGIVSNIQNKIETNFQLGECVVQVDPRYFRPAEVDNLLGDPSKAKNKLGWVPKIKFNELVIDMMKSDLKL